MDNYKIINTHTNEIIKALNDLGYVWTPKKFDEQDCLLKAHWILAKETGEIAYSSGTHIDSPLVFTELTLPQLHDLVVLKRNDISDANCIDKKREAWYLASDGTYYTWQYRKLCWDTESDACVEAHDIKPIKKHLETASGRFDENGEHHLTFSKGSEEKDPALISGAEALRALADGKEVECQNKATFEWFNCLSLSVAELVEGSCKYRIKPQTIKVELELPKPFEPKDGDVCFVVDSEQDAGFYSFTFYSDSGYHQNTIQFGAYRTEAEVKQVVKQLRKIRGTNS
ncbi:hypothetical protein OHW50_00185 [Acinetobacter baumannii]|nr:hypothetical protein [Acinetobacter baumannii]